MHDSYSLTIFTLRECVEKLQLLKTPEERQRRLTEIPEVHADPKMNPNCESEDDMPVDNEKKQGWLQWLLIIIILVSSSVKMKFE